jgi:Arm DNA-binding domain
VTDGGLYLLGTPDNSRPGNAATKLWRMGYRFHSRQKTYSIGPHGNGKDGTFSLADTRRERDKAKVLLKDGKDPSTEAARQAQAGGRSAFSCAPDMEYPPSRRGPVRGLQIWELSEQIAAGCHPSSSFHL